MLSLSVVILTYNEERHIARAIGSVKPFASNIVVIDSFSTDQTVEIARALGATVLQNRFVNQAKQFQWGMDNAIIESDWVMRLDADEVIEPELAKEISERIPALGPDVAGINLKRKHVFLGKWIRHGGRYPLILTRIWRKGQGRVEDRWMDEHIVVWGGETITFDAPFVDDNLNDLSFFTEKHNKYASREAVEVLGRRYGLLEDKTLKDDRLSRQAFVKRFVKEKIYDRMPFSVSALGYFVMRYVFQLGFLDGREGLIYHFLQGYWYRFLVGSKILEFERSISGMDTSEQKRDELSRISGCRL
ncbi:glycosyltransferase involved in cell wall biosynthesis [Neorhizobium galegae]|uniref:glycosyltransferase family 2 protein n=1 Tax=Neorhizobium galegae TaxID=399 RepID=UPI001AE15C3A|nr:glycosyltransferase family 2 protein [Neorhizobium galegae]MBP2550521.1 glycosyltransferase involved in cell wall biosynthesis [Neorhizobium galegae]